MAGVLGAVAGAALGGGSVAGAAVSAVAGGSIAGALGLPNPWHTGLCECSDDWQGCCDLYMCTCCAVARQCNALDGNVNQFSCLYCCCTLVVIYEGSFGLNLFALIIRYRIKEKYRITGESTIQACLESWFCTYCSLCQTSRELNHRGAYPGGTCCIPVPKGSSIVMAIMS